MAEPNLAMSEERQLRCPFNEFGCQVEVTSELQLESHIQAASSAHLELVLNQMQFVRAERDLHRNALALAQSRCRRLEDEMAQLRNENENIIQLREELRRSERLAEGYKNEVDSYRAAVFQMLPDNYEWTLRVERDGLQALADYHRHVQQLSDQIEQLTKENQDLREELNNDRPAPAAEDIPLAADIPLPRRARLHTASTNFFIPHRNLQDIPAIPHTQPSDLLFKILKPNRNSGPLSNEQLLERIRSIELDSEQKIKQTCVKAGIPPEEVEKAFRVADQELKKRFEAGQDNGLKFCPYSWYRNISSFFPRLRRRPAETN
eukprot:TRINITY_DN17849_c0_g3_i2.p1 TRINITY_DN17849_c0_g3~~TRINITY_DN17849_c0_g3_i2.p1  ORF type:complete len:320 (+),score=77.25 TRINITY_DN17849_c0_g3_i2:176-1135(+)